MPEPQQCGIRAASATYITAHGNPRSLTHWARPGTEPATSWFLVRFVHHCATTGTPRRYLNYASLTYSLKICVRFYVKLSWEVFQRGFQFGAISWLRFLSLLKFHFKVLPINGDFAQWPLCTVYSCSWVVSPWMHRPLYVQATKTSSSPHCVSQKRYGIDLKLQHYFPGLEAGNIWVSKFKNSLVRFWLLDLSYTTQN